MKSSIYAAAAVLLGVNAAFAGEGAIGSLKTSVSPSVLNEAVLPGSPVNYGAEKRPRSEASLRDIEGTIDRCAQARTMEFLAELENAGSGNEPAALARLVCHFSNEPTATVRYPDGTIAYAGPEYSDKGSWKYPGGQYAFVGEGWSDKGSWKYPGGNYALVGEGWSDKGAWKYPSGKYALVGNNYSDKGSWKYPNGSYALVGDGYSDKGAWKYPSGKYALIADNYSDKGSWKYPNGKYAFLVQSGNSGAWYYPNGTLFTAGSQGEGVQMLTRLVEDAYNAEFPYNRDLREALDAVSTMHRLQWIEQTMPAN